MQDLSELREEINHIDEEIVKQIAQRFKITKKVGEYKKANNLPILNSGREEIIYRKLESLATEQGIDAEMLKSIWQTMMLQSKKEQE
ncbi:MAG: chorismate mutase [Alphaproteobacteria bacterium]|jgi:chorismate mutase|nr:chorismate mutase [Alphaproteobacteria bacterium]